MSHDHGRRAACGLTICIPGFHSEIDEKARGVTAMVVGSGALLGLFCRDGKWPGLKSMIRVNRLGASSLRWGCNLESHLRSGTETFLRLRSRRACFLITANARLRAAKNFGLSSSRSHRTPNVTGEPRGVRHKPSFSNEKAGASGLALPEIEGQAPALALTAGSAVCATPTAIARRFSTACRRRSYAVHSLHASSHEQPTHARQHHQIIQSVFRKLSLRLLVSASRPEISRRSTAHASSRS